MSFKIQVNMCPYVPKVRAPSSGKVLELLADTFRTSWFLAYSRKLDGVALLITDPLSTSYTTCWPCWWYLRVEVGEASRLDRSRAELVWRERLVRTLPRSGRVECTDIFCTELQINVLPSTVLHKKRSSKSLLLLMCHAQTTPLWL